MNKTRYLQILFDKPFQAYNIPKLRGAIIEKTQRESNLFHNHLDDHSYVYRYPLIQYKIKDRKPCLICLREATEDIHYLLREKDYKFNIGAEIYDMEIEEVLLRYEHIQTWDRNFKYNILHYMALNQDNYAKYKKMSSRVHKLTFLQELLQKHLEIFAKAMDAHLPFPVSCEILEIKEEKFIEYKEIFHLCFSLNFLTNLHLPDYIGIGKGTSIGFGKIKKLSYNNAKKS